MDLIDHAYTILPARKTPLRKEDPFTAISFDLFTELFHDCCNSQMENPRIAIAFANCFGGWTFCEQQVVRLMERGPNRVSAFLSVAWFPAAAQGQVTIKHQLRVPALTFSTEFYAFYDALSLCQHWLEQGVCDIAFAGAAETVGSPFLTKATGGDAVNDAAIWFALTREGGEPIHLKKGTPTNVEAVDIHANHVNGSPLQGACALPLLLLEARKNHPTMLRVPKHRALIRASEEGLELWRMN